MFLFSALLATFGDVSAAIERLLSGPPLWMVVNMKIVTLKILRQRSNIFDFFIYTQLKNYKIMSYIIKFIL